MEQWELAARESIRDLVARYNANGDAGRFDSMLRLFAEGATMELPSGSYRGRAEILSIFETVAHGTGEGARARFIRHFTATHQIDVAGPGEASGRCYYVVFTERGPDHWGRYIDSYRCLDSRWLFWQRKVTVDASLSGGWV